MFRATITPSRKPTEGIEPPSDDYKSTVIAIILCGQSLYIILLSPLSVNVISCATTLWPTVECSIAPILPMSRRQLPRLLGFDLDYIASGSNIVVGVVHSQTIFHFHADKKLCLN